MPSKKITQLPTLPGDELADNDLLTIVDVSDNVTRQNKSISKYELATKVVAGLVANTRAIVAGAGLSGGGALDSDVTLSVDIADLTEAISVSAFDDYIMIHDHSAGGLRKLTIADLLETLETEQSEAADGVTHAYSFFTDGTTIASATHDDIIKFRSASGLLTITVTNSDPIHGDNVYFELHTDLLNTALTHSDLQDLLADTHTQYALLAGRSGGQTYIGDTAAGGSLTLQSTAHATRGAVNVADELECSKLAYHAAERSNVVTGTTATIDWRTGNKQYVDLTGASGDVTLTFSAPGGPASLLMKLEQGATPRNVNWPAATRWDESGEPEWEVASKIRFVAIYYDGSVYWAQASGTYATS